MSELAKDARKANRDKAERMTRADPHQKVDASSWTPSEPLGADIQNQPKRPVPRKFKDGGRVSGEYAAARLDKAPRHGPKHPDRKSTGGLEFLSPALAAAKGDLGALSPAAALIKGSRDDKDIPGKKRGGGVSVSDGALEGTRPTGGRLARKDGGRASKGKMNVNIIISTGPKPEDHAASPAPPPPPHPMPGPMPAPAAGPPMPPPGLMGAMGGPPPGMPPGMPPPMPRKRGGRAYYSAEAGAGSGLGRLQKADRA